MDHAEAAPIIGRQFASWAAGGGEADHYRWKVAPARNYAESTNVSGYSATVLSPPLRAAGRHARPDLDVTGTHQAALLAATCCSTTAHAPSIGQCKDTAHPDVATSTDCACAALLQALQQLRARGYVKGGTADCSIIAHGDRWYDPAQVRFADDEPSRHKLVDLTVRDTWSTPLSRRLRYLRTAGSPAC